MSREKIILYENLRACSYTPFYIAHMFGMFESEGLKVELQLSSNPSETAKGLIDGRAHVSFGGPMRVMLHHDAAIKIGENCPLVCFAQVVARDPFILIGKTPNPNFRFSDIVGPRIAVAVDVPTPWMTLWDDLDRASIDPRHLNRSPDATMMENTAAFERGEIDLIQVFEPYADRLTYNGVGKEWHRFSTRGDMAFTTFYTTKSFITERRSTCQGLVRAISNALKKLHTTPAKEIAKKIGPTFFPDLTPESLTRIITNYRSANLWPKTTALPISAYSRLKTALLIGGLISHDIPYHSVVDEELSMIAD